VPPQESDPTGAKILDGASRALRDFGVKRATVELVAKYAGVSHMTIYRRWPSKNDLLRAAVIGELTDILDTAFSQAAEHGDSFAERSLRAFSEVVWALQTHPLVIRELDPDSGEQLPLLSSTFGSVMEVSVPLVAERLAGLAPAGHDDPELGSVADVFVRLAHSMVVVGQPGQQPASQAEVASYARECFGPYLQARATPQSAPLSPPHRQPQRPYLQVAAAVVLTVLALGVGVTAGRTNVKLPFITPANATGSPAPATPGSPTPEVPGRPGVAPPAGEPLIPAEPARQQATAAVGAPSVPPTVPGRQLVPAQSPGQSAAVPGGSGGVGYTGGGAVADTPDLNGAPPPPPRPPVGAGPGGGPPPPASPGPKPPGPPAPGPGPSPAGPGPRPPGPAPANQGPANQGPANQGPNNQGPANSAPGKPGPGPANSGPPNSGPGPANSGPAPGH